MVEITSNAWGGTARPVSQGFQMGFERALRERWYDYAVNYGWPRGYHIALDISMPRGTKIYALNEGVVKSEGPSDSFRPNPVHILTDHGYEEIYGHMWTDVVARGQRVKPGQLLGESGEQTKRGTKTPDGSGPHLHFELRKALPGGTWKALDPTEYLGGGVPADTSGAVTSEGTGSASLNIKEKLDEFVGRSFVGLAGLVVMIIGLWAVIGQGSGGGIGKTIVKRAAKLTPQGKAVSIAAKAVKKVR